MNIFITWTSKWIWKYLKDHLENETIFEIKWRQQCDLSDFQQLKQFLDKLIPENLLLDVLILNAGFGLFWKFEEFQFEDYQKLINTNLLANIVILKFLEKHLHSKTKIIFIGSIISKKFMKYAAVYQASKFWLRWFAWWLKQEWKKVFLINPKIVDTNFHKWKVDVKKYPSTRVEDILDVVKNIINWEEKRFEIDL